VKVLAQVRFEAKAAPGDQAGITRLHELLTDDYPRLVPEPHAQVTVGPKGAEAVTVPQYRMTDLSGRRSVVLGTDHLTIEIAVHERWADLRERLSTAIEALCAVVDVRVRERVGVRFVHQFPWTDVEKAVRPVVLGPWSDTGIRNIAVAGIGQLVLHDGDVRMIVRHGAQRVGNDLGPFVVDIDCSVEEPVKFCSDDIIGTADRLHDDIVRFFVWATTDELRSGPTSG
jgi:uncharacterized protein (TIGR04255 family)